jgi:NAD(P)-dependent dehydrogenase (short-subunit alcohol dehydrogenase family)
MTDTKRAVVTGAARGIGQATALRLLAEGVEVVGVDRDADGLATVAEAGATPLAVDLSSEAGVDAVAAVADDFDYLVNCHGIIRLRPLLETSRQDWHELFAVNAESIFFLCQQIGPKLRPGGAIVNLSSVSAKLTSTAETAIYATTKTAILAITRAFAYALAAQDVRVNAVCPGITDTDMIGDLSAARAEIRGVPIDEVYGRYRSLVPRHHRHAHAGRRPGGGRGAARHARRRAVGGAQRDRADEAGRHPRRDRRQHLVPAVARQLLRDRRGDERLRRSGDVVTTHGGPPPPASITARRPPRRGPPPAPLARSCRRARRWR